MEPKTVINLVGVESEVHVSFRARVHDALNDRSACMLLAALQEPSGCKGGPRRRRCSHANISCGGHEFLQNGARAYLDHGYLEYATPACSTTAQAVAAVRSGDVLLCEAARRLGEALEQEPPVRAIRNNIDHRGHSFGAHVNVRMTRQGYARIFTDPAVLNGFLVPFFVSLPVLCGSGRCSSEGGDDLFQIWQRADFLRSLVGLQTTYDRPLVNSRDEALAADTKRYARFHIIAFDANRLEFAEYLKLGLLRLLCAAIDAGRIGQSLELDDPIAAIRGVSRCHLAPLRLSTNKTATALNIQRSFLARFAALQEQAVFAGRVPDAGEILARWDETLTALERDPFSLIGSLDWITKYAWLEQIRSSKKLDWSSPQMRWLDVQYHCLTGSGLQEIPCRRITSDDAVNALKTRAPTHTRAAVRGELLRRFGDEVADANWHWLVSLDGKTAYILPDDPRPEACDVSGNAETLNEAAAALELTGIRFHNRSEPQAQAVGTYGDKERETLMAQSQEN